MKIETLINHGVINDVHDNALVVVTPGGECLTRRPEPACVECDEVGEEPPASALCPLPWDRLFHAYAGMHTPEWVTQRLRMVHRGFEGVYFDCTEEAFLACFGLPEGCTARPVAWLSSARVLNYFIRKLYPGRVPCWKEAAAIFVPTEGTPYHNLNKQSLSDKEERQVIDSVMAEILKAKGSRPTPQGDK